MRADLRITCRHHVVSGDAEMKANRSCHLTRHTRDIFEFSGTQSRMSDWTSSRVTGSATIQSFLALWVIAGPDGSEEPRFPFAVE